MYPEEAAKKEVWLQLVEARQVAGLIQAELAKWLSVSQAQVTRVEKRGYDLLTLNNLRSSAAAPGDGFSLHVTIQRAPAAQPIGRAVVSRSRPSRSAASSCR